MEDDGMECGIDSAACGLNERTLWLGACHMSVYYGNLAVKLLKVSQWK